MISLKKQTYAAALLLTQFLLVIPAHTAAEDKASDYFDQIKHKSIFLRGFLTRFPKGGELHTHLDGAAYAENYINWAAEDGKCIDLTNDTITHPPCDAVQQRPPVMQIKDDPLTVNRLIDAMSIRNYEHGTLSGHDQFFVTFSRFSAAVSGREGDIMAEIADRAGRQNNHYLELMNILGMVESMSWGASMIGQLDPESLAEAQKLSREYFKRYVEPFQ